VSLVTAAAAVPALLIGQAGVALAAPAAPGIYGQMTSALAAELSQNVNQPVIVIMKSSRHRQPRAARQKPCARTRSRPPSSR
jgi:hypothetical protein